MCGGSEPRGGVDPCIKGRASVELVLRQLLRFPRAPAVVLVPACLQCLPALTMNTWLKAFRAETLALTRA